MSEQEASSDGRSLFAAVANQTEHQLLAAEQILETDLEASFELRQTGKRGLQTAKRKTAAAKFAEEAILVMMRAEKTDQKKIALQIETQALEKHLETVQTEKMQILEEPVQTGKKRILEEVAQTEKMQNLEEPVQTEKMKILEEVARTGKMQILEEPVQTETMQILEEPVQTAGMKAAQVAKIQIHDQEFVLIERIQTPSTEAGQTAKMALVEAIPVVAERLEQIEKRIPAAETAQTNAAAG